MKECTRVVVESGDYMSFTTEGFYQNASKIMYHAPTKELTQPWVEVSTKDGFTTIYFNIIEVTYKSNE